VIAGSVLIGQGVYIHAKAILAQILLSSFVQTLATGQDVNRSSDTYRWRASRCPASAKRDRARRRDWAGARVRPGHVARTAQAGDAGTAVYSAHRDTHFSFLGDVEVGDEIVITRRDGAAFRYRVTGASVVRWDASGIDPMAPGRHLVLATCWPLNAKMSGPLRYLVRAQR
jgi:sortase A